MKQVDAGLLDAAIVGALPSRPIDSAHATQLGTEKVVNVGPADLPGQPQKLADLAGLAWVINPDGCGFRIQLDQALASNGRPLNVIAEIWGAAPQLSLIAGGAGLGLLPERLVNESPLRHSLRILPIRDFEAAITIWLIRSGASATFGRGLDVLQQTVSRLLGSDAVAA